MKTVIKVFAFVLSVVMLATLFCACAKQEDKTASDLSSTALTMYGKEPDLEKLMQNIKAQIGIEGLTDVPTNKLQGAFGIDPQLVEKSACATASSKPFNQEIIIIKARDDLSYENILSILEIRLSILQDNAKEFPEKDRAAVEGFKIMNNGRYLAMFIAYNNKIAQDLFTNSF